jgi:hypothetical protein
MVQGHVVSRMQRRVAQDFSCEQGSCKTYKRQDSRLKANEWPEVAPEAVVMSVLCDHCLKLCNGATSRPEKRRLMGFDLFSTVQLRIRACLD